MSIKYVDQNSLVYIFRKIKDNFVAKEAGKGLSTNDFTNELKSKLEGVASGAQVNVLEKVSVNGKALTITEKGYGKLSDFDEFRLMKNRGGKGAPKKRRNNK